MKSENITLYFRQGTSDKVYQASLEEVGSGSFVVNFAYGRRGATLTTGTKTQSPADYASAKKIYDKLVKSKTAKGYVPGQEGPQYVHTDTDSRDTGVQCQLLNFIEESEAEKRIGDRSWWAQEKHDGKRMLIRKTDTVTAINRRGLSVGAPDAVLNSASAIEPSFLIDGEAVGEKLFVFDLLEISDKDIRSESYSKRMALLETLGLKDALEMVETAKNKKEKQQMYDRLKASGAEGIVFKKHSAPYTAGRPSSGGSQMKFKFCDTASVIVTKINEKRSVAMAVMDGDKQVPVGNVSIPPNKEIPPVHSVAEVRYLYAYRDGSLYQPVYIGLRDDMDMEDCSVLQLKYKKELQ
ncbi:MAG: RNA ligase family protein [Desulfococcaceae bacterium]|jgi:bifunctional non-homologous end joining protein LigD|nr:RNA ligase family protein [Desulfococcaceae bacterium]